MERTGSQPHLRRWQGKKNLAGAASHVSCEILEEEEAKVLSTAQVDRQNGLCFRHKRMVPEDTTTWSLTNEWSEEAGEGRQQWQIVRGLVGGQASKCTHDQTFQERYREKMNTRFISFRKLNLGFIF